MQLSDLDLLQHCSVWFGGLPFGLPFLLGAIANEGKCGGI
jgi:hypothetical protein